MSQTCSITVCKFLIRMEIIVPNLEHKEVDLGNSDTLSHEYIYLVKEICI